jgi:hypothetical protein
VDQILFRAVEIDFASLVEHAQYHAAHAASAQAAEKLVADAQEGSARMMQVPAPPVYY